MNAHRIVWQWCSQNISAPPQNLQAYLQNLAMGVVHAHQGGNMTPLSGDRLQEKTTETAFDPTGENKAEDGLNTKKVKDRIFYRLFEDMLVHVEIFYCWTSFDFTDTEGKSMEHDNGAHYLVCIGEIISAPPSAEEVAE